MTNDKFTNKSDIEYPLEEDFVGIKVLNNNTRLLDEKKANINDIENRLQRVAKESSEYSIEDKIKNIETKVKNIEDKIKNIEEPLSTLPNRKCIHIVDNNNITATRKEYFSVDGKSGNLVMLDAWFSTYTNEGGYIFKNTRLEIEIDGQNIYDIHLTNCRAKGNNVVKCGILNPSLFVPSGNNQMSFGFKYLPSSSSESYSNQAITKNIHELTGMLPYEELSSKTIKFENKNLYDNVVPFAYVNKFIPFKNSLKIFFTSMEPNVADSLHIYGYYNINN